MRFPALARFSLALAVFAGACSDAPTGPATPLELDEVFEAMSLSSILPGALDPQAGALLPMPSVSPVPNQCSYSASVQSFVCAPISADGVTITHGYALLSASGTPQPAFDKTTTAAVRTTLSMVGRIADSEVMSDVDMQQTMTLSGLLTRTHVLDGAQVMKMAMTMPPSPTAYTVTVTTTIAALVLPERGTSRRYPKSGSITTALAGDALIGSFSMTLTFNGTSKVAVTINDGGRIEQCTIDLAATGRNGSTCTLL